MSLATAALQSSPPDAKGTADTRLSIWQRDGALHQMLSGSTTLPGCNDVQSFPQALCLVSPVAFSFRVTCTPGWPPVLSRLFGLVSSQYSSQSSAVSIHCVRKDERQLSFYWFEVFVSIEQANHTSQRQESIRTFAACRRSTRRQQHERHETICFLSIQASSYIKEQRALLRALLPPSPVQFSRVPAARYGWTTCHSLGRHTFTKAVP